MWDYALFKKEKKFAKLLIFRILFKNNIQPFIWWDNQNIWNSVRAYNIKWKRNVRSTLK